MINKTALLTALVCVFASGCASHSIRMVDPVVSLDQDHRVIRHNFKTRYDIVEARPIKQDHEEQQAMTPKTIKQPTPNRVQDINIGKDVSTSTRQNKIIL